MINRFKRVMVLFGMAAASAVLSPGARGAAVDSLADGVWSNPATWSTGLVPSAADDVHIVAGQSVTVDVTTATARSVQVDGTLRFHRTSHSHLQVSGGNVTVGFQGTIDMGTSADPVSVASATLSVAGGSGRKIMVVNGGRFNAHGRAKSIAGYALTSVAAGGNQVTLSVSDVAGWAPGDQIVLGKTGRSFTDTTEISTITAVSGGVITFSPAAANAHAAASAFLVANLTRNVLVRNSDVGAGILDIDNYTSGAGKFSAAYAEFANIDTIAFDGTSADADISGSSIHHGEYGLRLFSDRHRFAGNVFAAHVSNNIILRDDAGDNVIEDNVILDDNFAGIALVTNCSRNVIRGNRLAGTGVTIDDPSSAYNLIENNQVSSVVNEAIGVTGPGNVLSGNRVFNNEGIGIHVSGGADNVLVGNEIFGNNGYGIRLSANSDRGVLAANSIYDTITYPALFLQRAQGIVSRGDVLGYTPAGVSRPNPQEVDFDNSFVNTLTLRGARVNPFGAIPTSVTGRAGSCLASYHQDFTTGTLRVQGDCAVTGAMLLDRAQRLYTSTATPPTAVRGAGHAAVVSGLDDAQVDTELIVVRYDGTDWRVSGSVSGDLGACNDVCALPGFTLDLNPSASPRVDDRVAFALLAASPDLNVRKQLLFRDQSPSVNGGKSKLTIPAGASLTLRGTAAEPSIIDKMDANYFTFVSSGAFEVTLSSVSNADADGLQLSGAGPVVMASATFKDLAAAGATRTFLTLRSLTSNATFYGMAFNATHAAGVTFPIIVRGSNPGLRWYFPNATGGLSGDDKDSDEPGARRLYWAESSPPQTPGAFLADPGAAVGDISLSWTAPIEDAAGTQPLQAGRFLIYQTTVSADLAGALPAQAQVDIPTHTAVGAGQTHVFSGLLLGVTYYHKIWAADEFGNVAPANAATANALPRRFTPLPPSNFIATGSGQDIVLSWTPPTIPPAPYRGSYLLEYSSASDLGPYSALPAVPASSTTITHPGLSYETTYYYRLYARDTGGLASAPATASGQTAELVSPAVVAITAGLRTVGVQRDEPVVVTFTRPMDPATILSGAVTLTRLTDNEGNAVSAGGVAISISSNPAGDAYTLSHAGLEGNSSYEVVIATDAKSAQGKPLAQTVRWSFTTLLDRTRRNVVALSGGVRLEVPANAFPDDGYVTGGAAPAAAAAATLKAQALSRDAYKQMVAGTEIDLDAFNSSASSMDSFAAPVTVSLSYDDANDDGWVDGPARLRARTLAVHWLDEAHNLWVRLPSVVDESAKRVSAQTSHFTTFALLSQADDRIEDAYAFPVPFRSGAGAAGITFTDAGQQSTIRIYTASGLLVREAVSDGASQWLWDLTNDDGAPVQSGIYLYRLSNGEKSKRGKLVVIR